MVYVMGYVSYLPSFTVGWALILGMVGALFVFAARAK